MGSRGEWRWGGPGPFPRAPGARKRGLQGPKTTKRPKANKRKRRSYENRRAATLPTKVLRKSSGRGSYEQTTNIPRTSQRKSCGIYENPRTLRTNKNPNEDLVKILQKSPGRRGSHGNLTDIVGPRNVRISYEHPTKDQTKTMRQSYENRRILRTNKKPNEHLMKILRKSSGRRGFSENLTSILRITNENQNEYHAKILRKSAAATNQKSPSENRAKICENRRAAAAPTNRGPYDDLAKILRMPPQCATARRQCNLHALIHYTNTLH